MGDIISDAFDRARGIRTEKNTQEISGEENKGGSSASLARRAHWSRKNSGILWSKPREPFGKINTDWRDPKPASTLLDIVIDQNGLNEGLSIASLHTRWDEILGATLGAHTRMGKYSDQNYSLEIICENTSWATQVRFMQAQLLERFEQELGSGIIREIKIR